MVELGHWQFEGEIPIDAFGFIYIIENKIDKRKYIGKKQMVRKVKRKPLKGKKNARRSLMESDWKTYISSSNDLQADIQKHGEENFDFKIIRFCTCKWELAYYEAKLQFDSNVLFDESYYNGIINCRISRMKTKKLLK